MYDIVKSYLGDHEVVSIINESDKTGFELIPSFGGRINRLRLTNGQAQAVDLVSGFSNAHELVEDGISKSAILFPFPNRINEGRYTFNGETYQFPINEHDKNNALHGFLTDVAFEVSNVELGEKSASIEMTYSYDGTLDYYPFAFDFKIVYEISDGNKLNVNITIENLGSHMMPFGFGWHPYFCLPNWTNTQLKVGDFENIVLNDRFIPDGKVDTMNGLSHHASVPQLELDHCFRKKSGSDVLASLINNGMDLRLDLWAQSDHFEYLQIYTPPGEDSIALEPMTCNVDVYNNKMGLRTLEPNQSFETSCGVILA